MKSLLSLLLASTFFLTQTLGMAQSAMAQDTKITSSNEDSILELADLIEHRGIELQAIADQQNMEAAHFLFVQNLKRNLNELREKAEQQLSTLTLDHAQLLLQNMNLNTEWIKTIHDNRAFLDIEKVKMIYTNQLEQLFHSQVKTIQDQANLIGYKKTFQDMADQFRSRGTYKFWTKEFWCQEYNANDDPGLAAFTVAFMVVLVLGIGYTGYLITTIWEPYSNLGVALFAGLATYYLLLQGTVWLFDQIDCSEWREKK